MAQQKAKTREELIAQDVRDLHKLGYAQQLFREMGGFQNFAISFTVISILTGAMLLYGYGLKFAGPVINTIGWPLVSIFVLIIAASMGEIASAYPTAGGLYYWANRLGGLRWAWVTAWMNMIGQITITAGIDIACAIYFVGLLTQVFGVAPDAAFPVFGAINTWGFYIFVMVIIMIPQVLINIFGIRLTSILTDFSVYWHIGGVFVMAILLFFVGQNHNSWSFATLGTTVVNPLDASSATFADGTSGPALILGTFVLRSPFFGIFSGLVNVYKAAPFLLCFPLAFLQAQWTYTGYDGSAHMAEETVMARLNSAWGIFLSVAVSSIVGYLVLMALTFAIPVITSTAGLTPDQLAVLNDTFGGDLVRYSIYVTATNAYPVLYIAYQSLQNVAVILAHVIALIVFFGMWLCGLGSITVMSRMWFAFARDDGMPGSGVIKVIHPTLRTPVNSIIITSIIAVLTCVYSAAYFVVTSISTITLYIAYTIPTFLNLKNKLTHKGEFTTPENAPWSLRGWGPIINFLAVVYTIFICILFCLPPNELVLWTMVGLAILLFIYWQLYEKHHFTGPKKASEEALRKVEADMAELAKKGKGAD